jgi:tetratricopeptide (TPR) repeat protein
MSSWHNSNRRIAVGNWFGCHTILYFLDFPLDFTMKMNLCRRNCRNFILLLSLCCPAFLQAENLGKVSFPISCTPESQAGFEQAVALMHSFQYPGARPAFAAVAEKEPQCAMAWWGQAIVLYQQLWGWPNEKVLARGHEFIAQAQAAGPVTARERMYIDAAAAFFDTQSKLSKEQREQRYTEKMADLWRGYPQDVEAGSLYALALLSWYQPDTEAARKQSIAILQDLFARAPDHPGVDHYLIHATDTSEFAALGLPAARRYAATAPASSHALHMPSHIFAQLGMWQEMIDSNLVAAAAAAEAARQDRSNGADYQIHPMQYLHYAYMQTARDEEAQKLFASLKDVPAIVPDAVTDEGLVMRALYIMEARQWPMAAQLDDHAPTVSFVRLRLHWVKAIAAAHLGDLKSAQYHVKRLHKAYTQFRRENRRAAATSPMIVEAEAWLDFARGRGDRAVARLRAAAGDEEFGVDAFFMPLREQLGDMLLELNRPAEALEAYEASLKSTPGRFNSLFGAGRSAQLAGHADAAIRYYAELLRNAGPNAERPQLGLARTALAARK